MEYLLIGIACLVVFLILRHLLLRPSSTPPKRRTASGYDKSRRVSVHSEAGAGTDARADRSNTDAGGSGSSSGSGSDSGSDGGGD